MVTSDALKSRPKSLEQLAPAAPGAPAAPPAQSSLPQLPMIPPANATDEDRTADATIRGFLYQFNKSLVELLKASDEAEITLEGIVEDIDIQTATGVKAIQCKYLASKQDFVLSALFKPLLQMMRHFHRNSTAQITYTLFVHFPNQTPDQEHPLLQKDLESVLSSEQKSLQPYIVELRGKIDLGSFLKKVKVVFGPTLEEMQDQVETALAAAGLPQEEITSLFYPNSLQLVATRSAKSKVEERKITKSTFLALLREIRSTAISRWTLATRSRRQVLKARREQLANNLAANQRTRYFVLGPKYIELFDERIVMFLRDFLAKYHHKQVHTRTPLVCLDCEASMFDDIAFRLHAKGIRIEDGLVGSKLIPAQLFRDPMTTGKGRSFTREFDVRIVRSNGNLCLLADNPCDDLFAIADRLIEGVPFKDVCIEVLNVSNWNELYYLLGLNNAID